MTQRKLEIIGPYTPEHEGPFCTRDGRHVRILCSDMRNEYTIVAIIRHGNGEETVGTFLDNGTFSKTKELNDLDLMNAEEVQQPREFWIVGSTAYSTHAAAYEALDNFGRLKIIHVREVLPGEGE
ncbi:hypothetical protein [Acetobacter ascendens]|uniref:hypothetical protein n=1 Tax=Acetobacter ascendens TaxID=481146 RepID=UPI000875B2DD|nr:hypothetical protein [Acetobacter ascendens]AOW48413.1 hypothetical protein A4R89_02170 [Acetobacter ascendens]